MSNRIKKFAIGLTAPLALLFAPPAALAQTQTAPAPAAAAPTVHAKPALWVVKDRDTTIYLFGTVHLMKPGISWFEGRNKKAFDSAQELVLEVGDEVDADTRMRLVLKGMDFQGPTLTSKLPPEQRPAFAALLKKEADLLRDNKLTPDLVDRMKPWFAALNLTLLPLNRLGYDVSNGVEPQLRQAATAQKKTISGLEKAEEQIGYFDGLSEQAQIAMLIETINEQATIEQSLDRMMGAWIAGNPVVLATELNKSMEEDRETRQILLIDRNNRWADWIKARLKKPGTVFIAVGSGHLAGKDSVQDALKARHVKSKLVEAD